MNNTTTQPPAAGEAAHTPTPWTIRNGSHYDYIYSPVESANGIRTFVARLPDDEQGKRDAAFIVRACNAYDANQRTIAELTEALERVIGEQYSLIKDETDGRATGFVSWDAMHQSLVDARAALARAKELKP